MDESEGSNAMQIERRVCYLGVLRAWLLLASLILTPTVSLCSILIIIIITIIITTINPALELIAVPLHSQP